MFIYRQGGKNRFCRLARFVIKCFVRHLGDILIHLHGNIISSRWESRFQSFCRKTRRRCPSGRPQARERLSSDNLDWTAIRLSLYSFLEAFMAAPKALKSYNGTGRYAIFIHSVTFYSPPFLLYMSAQFIVLFQIISISIYCDT